MKFYLRKITGQKLLLKYKKRRRSDDNSIRLFEVKVSHDKRS